MAGRVRSRVPVALSGGRIRRALFAGERPEGFGFFGGWRPDLSFDQVGPHQLFDVNGCQLLSQGVVTSELGYDVIAIGSAGQQCCWSETLQFGFVQQGASLYKVPPDGVTGLPNWAGKALVATFTTTARCAMVEFNGKLVAVHPIDGVFDYDGTTWTLRAAGVRGDTIEVWENKVWVAGDPNNVTRVWWSNAGSSATWTTATDFNELRDVNTLKIRALKAAQGTDYQGNGSLLAIKDVGVHRIKDSSTGAYKTLDSGAGCIGHNAIATSAGGQIGFVNRNGFFISDGFQVKRASDYLQRPLFNNIGSVPGKQPTCFSVVVVRDRFRVSIPTNSSTTQPAFLLEYDPAGDSGNGTWMKLANYGGYACGMPWTAVLQTGIPVATYVLAAGVANMARCDAGTNINFIGGSTRATWQTGALRLAPGTKCRIRSALFTGRGTWTIAEDKDWRDPQNTANDQRSVAMPTPAVKKVGTVKMWSYGVGEAISFSGDSGNLPAPSNGGTTPSHTIQAIALDFVPLV